MHTIWQIYLHIERVSIFDTAKGNWNLLDFTWKLSEPLNILPIAGILRSFCQQLGLNFEQLILQGTITCPTLGKGQSSTQKRVGMWFVFFPGRYRICFLWMFCRGVFAAFVELFFFELSVILSWYFFTLLPVLLPGLSHMYHVGWHNISSTWTIQKFEYHIIGWHMIQSIWTHIIWISMFQCFLARMTRTRTLSSFQWPLSNETCW